MEQFYPKKNNETQDQEGPSDLTIKRILAFSKAISSHNKKTEVEEKKNSSKN